MPEYVVTRWYRAPELLLSCVGYGAAIDVWSIGCILAEMLGRKPLFPGRDYIHTLNLVCRVVGTPSVDEIARFPSEKARHYLSTMPPAPRSDFALLFPDADPRALSLLDQLLVFDPAVRITAAEALRHPYFAGLYDPRDEPMLGGPLPPDPEIDAMPVAQVRAEVLREMVAFNPDLLRCVSGGGGGGAVGDVAVAAAEAMGAPYGPLM